MRHLFVGSFLSVWHCRGSWSPCKEQVSARPAISSCEFLHAAHVDERFGMHIASILKHLLFYTEETLQVLTLMPDPPHETLQSKINGGPLSSSFAAGPCLIVSSSLWLPSFCRVLT